jgi:hypothetical protein
MKPVFATVRTVASDRRRIILCEGEDERVLRAAQIAVDEKLASPILVGRPKAIGQSIRNQGLRLRAGEHYTVVDPEDYDRHDEYWTEYQKVTARRGVTPQYARLEVRRRRWSGFLALVTAAMLPLYTRLGMNPLMLACVVMMAGGVMNILPWGGPTARAAAALKVDAAELFVPMIPAIVAGAAWVIFVAWLFGPRSVSELESSIRRLSAKSMP